MANLARLRKTDCVNGTHGTDKPAMWLRIIDMVEYLRQRDGISQAAVARLINYKPSTISSAINGVIRNITDELLLAFYLRIEGVFNLKWVKTGEGEMLAESAQDVQNASVMINKIWAGDASNDITEGSIVADGLGLKNHYNDSPKIKGKWCPVIPMSMAKLPDFDIFGHISKQLGGNLERLYSGTANIDIWHYVTDNDLYPYYQKGDCLGLKAYEIDDFRIKTGNVYAVDTKRDGLITRRFKINENMDLESYTFNESDPQTFIIPKEEVIRIYAVVMMFRY